MEPFKEDRTHRVNNAAWVDLSRDWYDGEPADYSSGA